MNKQIDNRLRKASMCLQSILSQVGRKEQQQQKKTVKGMGFLKKEHVSQCKIRKFVKCSWENKMN